jgi:demethylmenaquinone methyltransferase/2-methoxy-6-polyprenyl-1,4-benzoquinol methylase
MAKVSGAAPGWLHLDVAAGTGDSSLALAKLGATVIATDFTLPMLKLGQAKFEKCGLDDRTASLGGDALSLPFRDGVFDGLSICYGIRNVEDRPKAYYEFLRVLKPGGILVVLEFSRPICAPVRWIYQPYRRWILPLLGGWISGDPAAYRYLDRSIRAFPDQGSLAKELEGAGFQNVRWENLSGGIVALHSGRKL